MISTTTAGPRRALAAGAALTLTVTLAACGGGKNNNGGSGGVLTVATGSTGNFIRNFNPFAPQPLQATNGMIYEPLFHLNAAKAGEIEPWLATKYTWSDGGKTLRVTVRTNATWNDGKPFTAEDVAWTFQMAKESKAQNMYALPIASANAESKDTALIKFSKSAYTKEYFILGKMKMLPKHIWSKIPVKERATTLNTNPVGTGPWKVKSVKGTTMDLVARDDYYFKGLPHFKTMRYRSFTGNSAVTAAVTSGQIDWGGGFIPDIKKNYLAKNKNFELVNIPLATTFFLPNAKQGPTADVNVRKAISAALDREFMNRSVYDGQAPVANPMALLLPNYESVLDPSLKDAVIETGQGKVDQYLTASGYTKSGGSWEKDGKKLSVTVELVSGWTDYVSVAQLAKQQLKKAGIELVVKAESYAQWSNNRARGQFQMLLDNSGYTPDPRAYYAQLVDSTIPPKIGESTNVGNFGRYSNPVMDKALDEIASTKDPAKQKPWYYKIQQEFVKDMPAIPLFYGQNEQEFNGNRVTGYPTEDNLYAAPSIWLDPDGGWVAARIKPVNGKAGK
ncbi:ABC transporter substrate-binding protein [Streptomyces sp. FXJ1.4098]|uniref:ABC transporter substrate-binding protein n=1 Tax=Streptomyces sp. NPDC020845 TaxID=3365096 RepID=UPI0029923CFF|nr:ABC transporter substrate-binding protein [Streptomyces sp. FXJ1.4098]